MKGMVKFLLLLLGWIIADESAARREILTEDQKSQLEKAERVLVEVLAITEEGSRAPGPLLDTVVHRMEALGYTVVTDEAKPHDVVFRVKCEQQKVWEGTAASGGDADLPDSPSRVWKGPACQFSYALDGKKMGWRKEVRTEFQDASQAAADAGTDNPGVYALAKLNERLQQYDFPFLLAAEWKHDDRLLKALDSPATTPSQKIKVVSLLGDMFSTEAVPRLVAALKDSDLALAKAAAVALGNIGRKESTAALVDLLKAGQPELQAAAAKGLGQVGALHGDTSIIAPLLEALQIDNLAVKTEVVWALGKLPDRRAAEPLYTLQRKLQTAPREVESEDPQKRKLKEAVNWSLKQIDLFDQFN